MAGFTIGIYGPSPFGAKSMTLYTQGNLTILAFNGSSNASVSRRRGNTSMHDTRCALFRSTSKCGVLTYEGKVVSIEIDMRQRPFAVDTRRFQVA